MTEPRMSVAVSDDGTVAKLSFLPASGMDGSIALTLEQLTTLVQALGAVRARMLVGHTVPPLEGMQIQAIVNPAWRVQPEALTEGSMLAFHHPAYGALGFVVSSTDVEKMVRALTAHLAIVRSSPTGERVRPS
jgi:hypothetical protein